MIKRTWKFLITCGIILMVVFLFLWLRPLFLKQDDIRIFIQSIGVVAPLIFIGLQLLQTIIPFVPGGFITLSGGYLFGVVLGTLYSLIGLVLGSFIVFSISNKYLAPYVKKSKNKNVRKLNLLLKAYCSPLLFVTRMIPFFPHDLFSYVVGSSSISRKKFMIATVLGFLPHAFIHSYVGDSVYQGIYGIGFYLILVIMVFGGMIYIFKDKIIDYLLMNKKKYKSKK